MTVIEALKLTVNKLEGINVPIRQTATIAAPISEAVAMISATIEALEAAEATQNQNDEKQEQEG